MYAILEVKNGMSFSAVSIVQCPYTSTQPILSRRTLNSIDTTCLAQNYRHGRRRETVLRDSEAYLIVLFQQSFVDVPNQVYFR